MVKTVEKDTSEDEEFDSDGTGEEDNYEINPVLD